MEEQKVMKRNVKWFLGGVSIATVIMLMHRHYELSMIGMGIDKIINNPELLTKFQELSRKAIK